MYMKLNFSLSDTNFVTVEDVLKKFRIENKNIPKELMKSEFDKFSVSKSNKKLTINLKCEG